MEDMKQIAKKEQLTDKSGKVLGTAYTEINQAALTSDCWMVQFEGLNACKECEFRNKDNCGGGLTLMSKLREYGSFSQVAMWSIGEAVGEQGLTPPVYIRRLKEGTLQGENKFVHDGVTRGQVMSAWNKYLSETNPNPVEKSEWFHLVGDVDILSYGATFAKWDGMGFELVELHGADIDYIYHESGELDEDDDRFSVTTSKGYITPDMLIRYKEAAASCCGWGEDEELDKFLKEVTEEFITENPTDNKTLRLVEAVFSYGPGHMAGDHEFFNDDDHEGARQWVIDEYGIDIDSDFQYGED
jgi:hypothetical protein